MRNGTQSPRNRLLAALPDDEFALLEPLLERVDFDQRTMLYDINTPIEYIYFPEQAVASILGVMSDGTAVETATVGNEGLVGLPVFLGTDRTTTQAFIQVPGPLLRLTANEFRRILVETPALRSAIGRYTQAFFTLVAQSSACNRVHNMSERCARWLLHSHDRIGSDEFTLTHQFLSQMIGVRRATVTEAMHVLQSAGAVSYAMGLVRVTNRRALEAASCECYAIIASEFARLLGPNGNGETIASPLANLHASERGISLVGDGHSPSDSADDDPA